MRTFFRTLAIVVLTVCFTHKLSAQQDVELVNSAQIMAEGNFYYSMGKYSKAANLYKKVGQNDTNYAEVLLDLCVAYNEDKEDSLCLISAKKGIELTSHVRADFYNLAGISLREMKRYDEAIKILDEGIAQYPYIFLLHYNKGKTFYEEKKFAEAEKCFQEAIRVNQYHALSHYYLGKCAFDQNRTIPAILSFEFYLILTTSNERADKVVTTVEDLYKNNGDFDPETRLDPKEAGDECFDAMLEIITSQRAIKPGYKNKTGLNYNFVKVRQMLFENMAYQANTKNWYMDYYVPLYAELQAKGHFIAFNYWSLSSLSDPAVQKGWKKNKKKIKAFTKWIGEYINDRSQHPALDLVTEKNEADIIFYDNRMVAGVGHTKTTTKKPYGEWIYFYGRSGFKLGGGMFNDQGKREGVWTYYHENGKVSEKTNYKNGMKDGLMELWHDNGEKRAEYTYKMDKANGPYVEYAYHGGIREDGAFLNDKPNGPCKAYHENGKVQYEFAYVNGKITGTFKSYDYKGAQLNEVGVLNGKKNGPSKEFYLSGKTESEGSYKNDEPFGQWKVYWENGQLMREGLYKDKGKREGIWKEYHENGKISLEAPYKAGLMNGTLKGYEPTGELVYEKTYKSDKLVKSKYYNMKGKVLSEVDIIGRTDVREYYPSGILAGEGDYENGKRAGMWTFYSSNGGWKTSTVNYHNDEFDGKWKVYHRNGKVATEMTYVDGVQHGYYKAWFPNGQIEREGWVQRDMKEGDWYEYNVRGIVTSHSYYINDEPHGIQQFFDERGRKWEDIEVKRGVEINRVIYDSTGAKVYSMPAPTGSGNFKPLYANGQAWHDATYTRGLREGRYTMYKWNGKTSWEAEYVMGNVEGVRKDYYDWDDQVYNEATFSYGSRHGKSLAWWENGTKRWEENYYYDELEGEQRYYHPNGQLQRVGTWIHDELDGELKFYSNDGMLIWVRYYHDGNVLGYSYEGTDGELVPMKKFDEASGKVECYYRNGKKSIEGEFLNGQVHGHWLEYYSDGTLKEDETYNYGDREGAQKRYYPDGKPEEIENYYAGEIDGECKYFYPNGNVKRIEAWTLSEQWGKWYFYNEQGQLTSTAQFFAGLQLNETVVPLPAPAATKPKPKTKAK